jgi:hypothetical protein
MNIESKPVEALTIRDLEAHPVWQYINNDRLGEAAVRPVKQTPVSNLVGKLVGTQVRLQDGKSVWAIFGNIDNRNARMTEHFLTISLLSNGQWFTLSRYHDADYPEKGPQALARFLGLGVDEVFPIAYDVRDCVVGDTAALAGKILKVPREILTRAEIIGMAVP